MGHAAKKMNVFVTIPSGESLIRKECVALLSTLQADKRHKVTVRIETNRPVDSNMCVCAELFLEGDYDYWLTFDDDNPCTKNPLDLIDLDKDVIGFPTPMWRKGFSPELVMNTLKRAPDGLYDNIEGKGLFEVDAVGTGCMLIARRVIEKVDKPYFTKIKDTDGVVIKGHDIYFCEEAKEEGFTIWTHYDYLCHHYKTIDLLSLYDKTT